MALKDTYGHWAQWLPTPIARAWEAFLDAIDSLAVGALPPNVDGGNCDDVYLVNQSVEGGEAGTVFSGGQALDGGTA